jgi:hypothetical protein
MGGGVKVAVCYIHGGLACPRESTNGERKMPILYTCTFSFVLIASTSKISSSISCLRARNARNSRNSKLD